LFYKVGLPSLAFYKLVQGKFLASILFGSLAAVINIVSTDYLFKEQLVVQ